MLVILPRTVNLGAGHYMVTTAELDPASLIVSFTEHMTCTNKLGGFTGGVLLTYVDSENHIVGNSGVQQNGIGQAPLIGAAHRTINWNGLAPDGTTGLLLAQFYDPHNRLFGALGDIGNAFLAFAESAVEAAAGVLSGSGVNITNALTRQWCDQNPD
jgi:hypothetical protein